MNLFDQSCRLEKEELENSEEDPLLEAAIQTGNTKVEEPQHKTKRLRNWPGEKVRREIYKAAFIKSTNEKYDNNDLTNFNHWKQKEADKLWEKYTSGLPETEVHRLLEEYAIYHISNSIANILHLETIYTSLKPLGEKQWEIVPASVKEYANEEAIAAITDKNPSLYANGKLKKLDTWIKGSILYLGFIESRYGKDSLVPTPNTPPDQSPLHRAAIWAIQPHLEIKGIPTSLQETNAIFEKFKEVRKRENVKLELLQKSIQHLYNEELYPCPQLDPTLVCPWIICWNFLPIQEPQLRKIAKKLTENKAYFEAICNIYKRRILDRWVANVARRAYTRTDTGNSTISKRWNAKMLIWQPMDKYVNDQISANVPYIKLTTKTEFIWAYTTEDLPEPEYI
jgi:hypothetical protein